MLNRFPLLYYDPVTLTVAALATAGAVGGTAAYGANRAAKDQKKANAEIDKAKQDAEQKALMDVQEKEKASVARKTFLDQPTSGFGPNTNLARSFLTSL